MLEKLNVLRPLGLLLVRLAVGAAFMAHGYPKLFQPTEQMFRLFANIGFPTWTVYLAGAVEFFGGLLLVIGLFTRVAAFFLSGQMAVAFLKAHYARTLTQGYLAFLGSGADEYPLVLCVVAFLLLTLGAGAISVDRLVFREKA